MAEPAVSIVLETIRNLLVDEVNFVRGVKGEVEEVRRVLKLMQSFLKDADERKDVDNRIRDWVADVRETACDIEDILLIFAIKISLRRRISRNIFKRLARFINRIIVTHRVGNEIVAIKKRMISLNMRIEMLGIKSIEERENSRYIFMKHQDLRRCYSHVIEDDLIGMKDDIKLLAAHLINEQKFHVISIVGMGGLGKTTMARKLYHHKDIRRHFDGFAWACITQQWEKKDILQGILIKLVPERRKQIVAMRDEELVRELYECQLKKKCLVVLDDIWSIEAWESLKSAFPVARTGSKILLTTRNRTVAAHAFPSGFLHEPALLNEEESWKLLQRKALLNSDDIDYKIDEDMEKLGREMVGRCGGLPLAVVVLGGLLVTRHTLREWQMVHQNIIWYLTRGEGHGQQQAVTEVLAFSYHDLPYQLKQCFLYLANFPEDFEIQAEKIYQLWLAEGMILLEDQGEEETMMDVAERYLGELAQRCMVQVHVKETTGNFKSCFLHDLMRDLCLSKVKDENFTRVIDFCHEKNPLDSYSSSYKMRRASIYLDSDFHTFSPPVGEACHIRSIFYYANDCREEQWHQIKSYFGSLKLLRVLDLHGFSVADPLPEAIGDLNYLRYFSIRYSEFKELPSSVGKLTYLQTLDLEMTDISLTIPNVLWKLKMLSHLYLPSQFRTKDNTKLRLDGLNNLETLVNFDTSLCDVKDLHQLISLRKIRAAVREKLEDLPTIIEYMVDKRERLRRTSLSIRLPKFCSNEELCLLRQLLSCHHLHKLLIDGRIGKLPGFYHFSPSLSKLAFRASELEEDPMVTLEKLPKLNSLTFYDSSFVGKDMACSALGFPQLKYLKLWKLSNFRRWTVHPGGMPNLSRLVIAHCEELEMLPEGLQYITTLQKLNIRWMTMAFKNRLRTATGDVGEDFYKVRHIPDIKLD